MSVDVQAGGYLHYRKYITPWGVSESERLIGLYCVAAQQTSSVPIAEPDQPRCCTVALINLQTEFTYLYVSDPTALSWFAEDISDSGLQVRLGCPATVQKTRVCSRRDYRQTWAWNLWLCRSRAGSCTFTVHKHDPALIPAIFLLNQRPPLMITTCNHDRTIPKIRPLIPAASPQPVLPQELIDVILDYLYNDDPSLRACALVSSSWSGRSQQHLFARITLAGRPWPDKPKSRTAAELFLHLIERAPHIPRVVRHLQIIEGDIFECDRWLGRSIPVLDRILPALTKLRTLHIDFSGVLWSDIPGIHTSFLSASKLPDLHKVTMTSFPGVPSWDTLFTWFEGSKVSEVSLVNVTTCTHTYGSVPGSVRIPFETLSLSLESNELWRLSLSLANPSCVLQLSGLRKLRINILYSREMKVVSKLLEKLRIPSLQAIEIQLEALHSADANHMPDISRFRHVRLTLAPEGLRCESEGWISASIAARCWERLLRNFRENDIETVTLMLPKIHPNKFPEAERMYWVALDAALTRADMSHLRRVYLVDESSQGMGYCDAVINDLFPNLYERGLLVF
ncbi:hypothetical protein IW261DRAFT_1564173 [Armillaria novae-zelandiae]|uniref:F-box domain-containing protein n=1 Tax=Armillaria novae-zelandiae TaxID=153914 RepID=A0AA39P9E1_9AGAR|nr:hypothetical protein IW261DRAFT_1564173 [Armillaria novae-zelandiae]